MTIRPRLTMQGATLKGRWEDVKGANSGPVELALWALWPSLGAAGRRSLLRPVPRGLTDR